MVKHHIQTALLKLRFKKLTGIKKRPEGNTSGLFHTRIGPMVLAQAKKRKLRMSLNTWELLERHYDNWKRKGKVKTDEVFNAELERLFP